MFQILFQKASDLILKNITKNFAPILGILFLFLSYLYNSFETNSLFSTVLFGFFLFIIPYSLGQKIWICLTYLFKRDKSNSFPVWVIASVNWMLGVIYLNIPFILNSFVKQDVRVLTIFFIILLLIFSSTKELIKKPNLNSVLNHKVEWSIVICGALVVIYYLFIGSRMGFTSFNSDNPQNIHLANIFKYEKVYSLFAYYLTPQSTTIQYTTVLTAPLALASYFFDYRYIMDLMYKLEIFLVLVIYWQRFNFFKFLFFDRFKNSSGIDYLGMSLLSLLSCILFFGGVYMPGTFYNQQVLVFCFPTFIYFLYEKNYRMLALIFLLALTFHFTLSIIVLCGLVFIFTLNYLLKKKTFRNFELIIRYSIISSLFLSIFFLYFFYFNFNSSIIQFLLERVKSQQFSSSITINSNISSLQILLQGVTPVFFVTSIIGIFYYLFGVSKQYHSFFGLLTLQLLLIILPIPNTGRMLFLFGIIYPIILYVIVKDLVSWMSEDKRLNNLIVSLVIGFMIFLSLVFSFVIKTNDQDLSGEYINNSFISKNYLNLINETAEDLKKLDIDYPNTQIVSDLITKQYLEVAMYKKDDLGVYEEDLETRLNLHKVLNNTIDNSCKIKLNSRIESPKKYLAYLLTDRSEKWRLTPQSLATNFSYGIWFSKDITLVEKGKINSFLPNVSGAIIYQKNYDQGRLILIKCKD